MRLCLFHCDHVDAEIFHVAGDYADMFQALFRRIDAELDVEVFDVIDDLWPERLEDFDAFWISGSRDSVYDDVPWIRRLAETVRRVAALGMPQVGICFGHQMLAHALGGRVEKSARGWGVGVHRAEVISRQQWMNPTLDEPRLIMSHQDQVVELPKGGRVLTKNDHCPISALMIGESNVGIQGHPEFTPAYAEALMMRRLDRIPPRLAERAAKTLEGPHDGDHVGRWLLRFLRTSPQPGAII